MGISAVLAPGILNTPFVLFGPKVALSTLPTRDVSKENSGSRKRGVEFKGVAVTTETAVTAETAETVATYTSLTTLTDFERCLQCTFDFMF